MILFPPPFLGSAAERLRWSLGSAARGSPVSPSLALGGGNYLLYWFLSPHFPGIGIGGKGQFPIRV